MQTFRTDTLEQCGVTVQIDYFYDHDTGVPWVENDGHGVIEKVHQYYGTLHKKPGQKVMHYDSGTYWLYDFCETTKIAKRDGWGLPAAECNGLTKNQIIAKAVQNDFDFCRGWITDQWFYAGVICTVLDRDGEKTDITNSCWGFETFKEYHITSGIEMASYLAESTYKTRLGTWRKALHEARSKRYWACRDIVTV